ncbi:MAG: hypothetical protein JWO94_2619 [Verrucomicrobiaceae bacterium]|nr:hypothetical protein [Verrucomicrobiaceae bacterium]
MREFLRARFPEAHTWREPETELPPERLSLMARLGMAQGTVTEVVAPQAGAGLLITCLLERESAGWEPTALVDGCDAFDPWSVPPAALEKLLWLRCRETDQAMKATDLLLRDGNIPLVLLDLQRHTLRAVQGVASSIWHRLRLLAEKGGCSLCVLTPGRSVPCARSRIILEPCFALADMDKERPVLAAQLHLRTDRQSQVGQAAAWKATA